MDSRVFALRIASACLDLSNLSLDEGPVSEESTVSRRYLPVGLPIGLSTLLHLLQCLAVLAPGSPFGLIHLLPPPVY